jgi:hypothetical protein
VALPAFLKSLHFSQFNLISFEFVSLRINQRRVYGIFPRCCHTQQASGGMKAKVEENKTK